jgi:hypothetical protein
MGQSEAMAKFMNRFFDGAFAKFRVVGVKMQTIQKNYTCPSRQIRNAEHII